MDTGEREFAISEHIGEPQLPVHDASVGSGTLCQFDQNHRGRAVDVGLIASLDLDHHFVGA